MEQKVLEILYKLCGTDEVIEDKDIDLFENGLLDSLGMIELLLQIEEKLGIQIQPTEIERDDISTPNKLIQYLLQRG